VTPARPAPGIAFFDVDETLVRVKSMFSFLHHYLTEERGEPERTYHRLTAELRAAYRGRPREQLNRGYYRLLAGADPARLAAAGRAWFGSRPADSWFVADTVAELRRHQAAGATVVLLSGSFSACLAPIAGWLGVDRVLGTRPEVRGGRLTGEVLLPMIGARKGRAAELLAAVLDVPLAGCSAYADDASDRALLEAVGDPVVVGADPVLTALGTRRGWRQIHPGTTGEASSA
jgi:HAD superfamily hydrolase (TIGR01490 family)